MPRHLVDPLTSDPCSHIQATSFAAEVSCPQLLTVICISFKIEGSIRSYCLHATPEIASILHALGILHTIQQTHRNLLARLGHRENRYKKELRHFELKPRDSKVYEKLQETSTRSLVCPFTLYSPKCSAQHYTEAKPLSRPSP